MTDTEKIAALNDLARTAMGVASRLMQTQGISALPASVQSTIREHVETFTDFTPDNDPFGERDCASMTVEGHRVIWKIDYYDPTFTRHSDDAADPAVTRRVLTIMLAEEY
jgi:Protein of unknown function (DUF3768)